MFSHYLAIHYHQVWLYHWNPQKLIEFSLFDYEFFKFGVHLLFLTDFFLTKVFLFTFLVRKADEHKIFQECKQNSAHIFIGILTRKATEVIH